MVHFAYWDIRGLSEPIRLMHEWAGADYTERRYVVDPATMNREDWLNEKFTLGLDFPNLPYMIDGDLKISQSNAIFRYLGKKFGFVGKDDQENAVVDMVGDQVFDLRNGWVRLCYNGGITQEMQDEYREALKPKLEDFQKFLGDKKFLTGDEIRWPDFHFVELLMQHSQWDSNTLSSLPQLQAYVDRFQQNENIKRYLESGKRPQYMNNVSAKIR